MEHWKWQHERELSKSKGRPGQCEELCLKLFQVVIGVWCFEIISEYSAAACTCSGAFLEQAITITVGPHKTFCSSQENHPFPCRSSQSLQLTCPFTESTISLRPTPDFR